MSIQLNQKATGGFLEKATERLSGQVMRTLNLFVEVLSSRDLSIDDKHTANIVVKDKNGRVTYMGDSSSLCKTYKLHAGYPMFLKFEFHLLEEEWKALLQGPKVQLTLVEEFFDISGFVDDLKKNEEKQ